MVEHKRHVCVGDLGGGNMDFTHLLTIVFTVFASSGFWSYVQYKSQKRSRADDMLLGLAHDRIYDLCKTYIAKENVTHSELDNLIHLYEPYTHLGGNGTAKTLMEKVEKLPIVED